MFCDDFLAIVLLNWRDAFQHLLREFGNHFRYTILLFVGCLLLFIDPIRPHDADDGGEHVTFHFISTRSAIVRHWIQVTLLLHVHHEITIRSSTHSQFQMGRYNSFS